MTRNRKKPFPFFLWHRRIGLLALIFMVILSITGILLNHTEELALDEITVESSSLLNWYELNPEGEPIHFRFSGRSLTQWDKQIFFNSQPVLTSEESLSGFVELENILIASLNKSILLLDKKGELIEQIETEFEPIKAIGRYQNQLALIGHDNQIQLADEQILGWEKAQLNMDQVEWSDQSQLGEDDRTALSRIFRGSGLSLERVILDLHSGRIFNDRWGIYLMDASAIFMLLLSISGCWIWYTRRQKIKSKRHYQKHHR